MKIPSPVSIRKQLLVWLLLPILFLFLVSGLISYYLAIGYANEAYDNSLADSALALSSRLRHQTNGRYGVDLPRGMLDILKKDYEDRFYYRILGRNLRYIAGEENLPAPPEEDEFEDNLYFSDTLIGKLPMRVATLRFVPEKARPREVLYVQVAETFVGRDRLTEEILISVLLPQLLMILLAMGAVWLGITKGLQPLDKLRQALSSRSSRDLTPLDQAQAPTEVKPLVSAIDTLLGQLSEDLEIQRRFVANAAHQLRTPFSGLKTQTELALRQTEMPAIRHALTQIEKSIDRGINLAERLLALAKAEPGAFNPDNVEDIDLLDASRKISKHFVPAAIKKNIDLGFEAHDTDLKIRGYLPQVEEMLSNLIDNALRYTPENGHVTVRAYRLAHEAILEVEDTGIGISAEEKVKVFERFYRVQDNNVVGSGLGLAIVSEIIQNHNAKITLTDALTGQGTLVQISFNAV